MGKTQASDEGDLEELRNRHSELERRLAELGRHVSLSAAEQLERSRIKKEKLLLKDRMLSLESSGTR